MLKQDLSNRTHLVKVYLNDSEYEKVCRMVKGTKNTNSNFFRQLLRASIFVEFPPNEFNEIICELNRIGINLNQLARIAHQSGYFDEIKYRQFAEMVWNTTNEFSQMYHKCGAYIDEAVRKGREKKV